MQNKEVEIAFFDNFGFDLDYDVFKESSYKRLLHEFRKFINTIDTNQILKAIDLGCGTGSFTKRLREFNLQLSGLDISPKSIEYAKSQYVDIKFHVGDLENLPFDNESYDIVFLSGVIHHFPEKRKMLKEVRRILSPNGIILAYDPHAGNPMMWLYRRKESPFYSSRGVTENEQPLYRKELVAELANAGFSENKVYAISGFKYKYIESRIAFLFLPMYNFIETLFDLPLIRQKFGSFLITYAKK